QFVRSLKFRADDSADALTWTVPDGWKKLPTSRERFAAFQLGDKLEVAVTQLGSNAASVPPNVNRWRGQLGLRPIGEVLIKKLTKEIAAGDVKGTLIDMSGPGGTKPPPVAAAMDDDEPGSTRRDRTANCASPNPKAGKRFRPPM